MIIKKAKHLADYINREIETHRESWGGVDR